ncbi:hypothetical protein, partial [Rhodovibrio sodomensis]|uniref:hypothetical protein n=1 Tax=Rhodovibrio sodomensis TaxID=1088 RepID=UPI001A91FB9F
MDLGITVACHAWARGTERSKVMLELAWRWCHLSACLSLLIITSDPKTNEIEPKSYSIIPCKTFQATSAWFEHSNLFKVNVPSAHRHLLKGIQRHADEPTDPTV